MSFADEVQKLQQLKEGGALTEEEFQKTKDSLLAQQMASQSWNAGQAQAAPRSVEADTRTWSIFLHLSTLLLLAFHFVGILFPILIWQLKKNELPALDEHGKNVMNWAISLLIYILLCIPFVFILIGIPVLVALGIVGIIFPIIGAVQASKDIVWKYPMSIPFFK